MLQDRDAGVASAMTNAVQEIGGSIGVVLLNSVAAGTTARYLSARVAPGATASQALHDQAMVRGFSTATWWTVGILMLAALVTIALVDSEASRERGGSPAPRWPAAPTDTSGGRTMAKATGSCRSGRPRRRSSCGSWRSLPNGSRWRPESLDPRAPIATYRPELGRMVGMVGDLERWLGRTLSATLMWEYPTIEALADSWVRSAQNDIDATLARAKPTSRTPARRESTGPAVAIIGIGCRFPGGADSPDGVLAAAARGPRRDHRGAGRPVGHRGVPRRGPVGARQDEHPLGRLPRRRRRVRPALLRHLAARGGADGPAAAAAGRDGLGGAGRRGRRGRAPRRIRHRACSSASRPTTTVHLQFQDLDRIDAYTGTGNAFSIAANRLSYLFDLRGPSMAVDTACSSSLVAVHQACQSLARGRLRRWRWPAGVNLILSPALAINFSKAGAMAPDGRCKAFDARADGYVRAEGAGIVVLKPLRRRTGRRRLHLRRHPRRRGQPGRADQRPDGAEPARAGGGAARRLRRRGCAAPETVDYVEAHGTGTLLGRPDRGQALVRRGRRWPGLRRRRA